VGLGANLGEPARQIREALKRLSSSRIRPICVSSLYRTEPVGWQRQPWFVNAVVCVLSDLMARELLERLLEIEMEMGRRREIPMGPRTIDLDLLMWGGKVIKEEGLEIPHPRMHERRFVLVPMCEIAPGVIHPVIGHPMAEILERSEAREKVHFMEAWGVA
jgi:2-amino-4-hydroxy-6-hydroxymethyldihydropteridine diphosphokinase